MEKQIVRYSVLDVVGAYCVSVQDGQKIYELIHPLLVQHNFVELDFSAVNIITPLFLNTAIGKLFDDIEREVFEDYLRITHFPPLGESILERVIENALFFHENPELRNVLARVLQRIAQENDVY